MYLLRDLCGDGDACLADECPEEPPHRAQVLDVDRAQLRHRSLLAVKVVLTLLFSRERKRLRTVNYRIAVPRFRDSESMTASSYNLAATFLTTPVHSVINHIRKCLRIRQMPKNSLIYWYAKRVHECRSAPKKMFPNKNPL